jgi:outer membrane protein assembly factor BamA
LLSRPRTKRPACVVVIVALLCCAATAHADERRAVSGFRVKGDSKVKERTIGYLAHVHVGDRISNADIPRIEEALVSSELFEKVKVRLEDAPDGGVVVVVEVEDKLSWIVGPTLYLLSTNKAFGVGFVENDLGGRDQKLILYGQLGTQQSILFGTFLDPSVHGTKWQYRVDTYLERRQIDEYTNPRLDPTDQSIARTTQEGFFDFGALLGYTLRWWAVASLRVRGAWVYFRNPHDPNTGAALPSPEKDGWDVTAQARLTLDHRFHRFGVTWGSFLDMMFEPSVPGLDSYGYGNSLVRAYYSWVMFDDHQLELRSINFLGWHMPFHEDNALGGVGDLRGYPTDQFRGDLNVVFRAEYSVPMFQWWMFKFRGIGFYDWGYSDFLFPRSDRNFLPNQLDHPFIRDDIGLGLRVYVKAVVLPLLGLDIAYGIQARSPEIVFELGLTDF